MEVIIIIIIIIITTIIGRFIALSKKDGGIRPISIRYTLCRLATKCANQHIIERSSALSILKSVL